MGFLDVFKNSPDPIYDDNYWKERQKRELADKDIVTRYVACFGNSHYGDFCGIKQITGFYDKTYLEMDHSKSHEENWTKTVPIFYQTDFDDSTTLHGHSPERVFETREIAQKAYNENVHLWTKPFQDRIDALNAAVKEG